MSLISLRVCVLSIVTRLCQPTRRESGQGEFANQQRNNSTCRARSLAHSLTHLQSSPPCLGCRYCDVYDQVHDSRYSYFFCVFFFSLGTSRCASCLTAAARPPWRVTRMCAIRKQRGDVKPKCLAQMSTQPNLASHSLTHSLAHSVGALGWWSSSHRPRRLERDWSSAVAMIAQPPPLLQKLEQDLLTYAQLYVYAYL